MFVMLKTKIMKVFMEPFMMFQRLEKEYNDQKRFDEVINALAQGRADYFAFYKTFDGFFDSLFQYCTINPKLFSPIVRYSTESFSHIYEYRIWKHFDEEYVVCFHEGTFYIYSSVELFNHSILLNDLHHEEIISF